MPKDKYDSQKQQNHSLQYKHFYDVNTSLRQNLSQVGNYKKKLFKKNDKNVLASNIVIVSILVHVFNKKKDLEENIKWTEHR